MDFILEFLGGLLEGTLENRKIRLWVKLILIFLLLALFLGFIWYPAISAGDTEFLRPIILTVLITALLIALAIVMIRRDKESHRHP